MNIRQRMVLEPHLQKVHNDTAHQSDRIVFVGALIIGVIVFALIKAGVIA